MQGLKAVSVFSGHNADDIAETVLLNLVRGDLPRLGRCAGITTGEESALPRVKPFKFAYEKDIVMYAYFKKLDYFSTECIYAPYATRGFAREFIKDLEVSLLALLKLKAASRQHAVNLLPSSWTRLVEAHWTSEYMHPRQALWLLR